MQMVLILFYAEQLKQEVLDLIQNTDGFRARMESGPPERVPKDAKGVVRLSLQKGLSMGRLDHAVVPVTAFQCAIAPKAVQMDGEG